MAMITKPSIASVLVVFFSTLAHLYADVALDNFIAEFLEPHNRARAVEGLPPVVWNDTVAEYAQLYAQQRTDCQLIHTPPPRVYGENLAMSNGEMSPTEAVEMWVGEKPYYDYASNTCAQGQRCGHYTQIVWRDTASIGCAKVPCTTGGTFINCEYYPPGNYIGQRPF